MLNGYLIGDYSALLRCSIPVCGLQQLLECLSKPGQPLALSCQVPQDLAGEVG